MPRNPSGEPEETFAQRARRRLNMDMYSSSSEDEENKQGNAQKKFKKWMSICIFPQFYNA